jgi:ABC-2 type transport system permease protein
VERVRPSRVWTFAVYEIRRALAKKIILVMALGIALLVTVPYFILANFGASRIPLQLYPYLWIAGVLLPYSFFIQFLAVLIAAGAMSGEYEAGTAELLLAKPVSRTEFFVGKFLGGYLLLLVLIVLDGLLSVASATLTFGAQTDLGTLPGVLLVEVYSSALFFSVAFTLGELVRRSTLAYILNSVVILGSEIVGSYLSFAYELTGDAFYATVHTYLPTTIAGSIPTQFEQSILPSDSGRIFELLLGNSVGVPSESVAALLVGACFVVAVLVGLAYFRWADVSRRTS